jgi:hypothetical protein
MLQAAVRTLVIEREKTDVTQLVLLWGRAEEPEPALAETTVLQ